MQLEVPLIPYYTSYFVLALVCCPIRTRSRVTKYFTRFTHKIQSARDPGSPTILLRKIVDRLRLSRPCGSGKKVRPQYSVLRPNFFMLPDKDSNLN